MIEPCNHTYTQVAFILSSLEENITENTLKIKIYDYEDNKDLQKEIIEGTKILCCFNKHKLIKCWSTLVHPYFRHHYNSFRHSNETHISFESKWHIEWKNNFNEEDREVCIPKIIGSNKDRRIDVKLGNLALEFQHSEKHFDEINAKVDDYNLHNLTTMWMMIFGLNFLVSLRCHCLILSQSLPLETSDIRLMFTLPSINFFCFIGLSFSS